MVIIRSEEMTGYRENIKEKHDQFKKQIVNSIKGSWTYC